MKKIFTILLVTITAFMLSSCVIFLKDKEYDITCYNNTYSTITDWCVQKDGYKTYANSDRNCSIPGGREDTIENLPSGEYQIFFTFVHRTQLHENDYEGTGHFDLDEDVIFYVAERRIYSNRSAASSTEQEDEDYEPEFVLTDSNGKEYPLTVTKK